MSGRIEKTTTELFVLCIVVFALNTLPHTSSFQAGLETLDTHNGEKEPEEAYKEADMYEQGSGFLETPKDDLVMVGSVHTTKHVPLVFLTYGSTVCECEKTQ